MNPSDDNLYGYYGWREFSETRQELLNEFDRSKGMNQSRPVKTEHGKAGEAIIRKWLANLLPQRFGVHVFDKNSAIGLYWSYNEFSRFVITFLSLLEGKGPRDKIETVFGQVFDKIQPKKP